MCVCVVPSSGGTERERCTPSCDSTLLGCACSSEVVRLDDYPSCPVTKFCASSLCFCWCAYSTPGLRRQDVCLIHCVLFDCIDGDLYACDQQGTVTLAGQGQYPFLILPPFFASVFLGVVFHSVAPWNHPSSFRSTLRKTLLGAILRSAILHSGPD